MTTLFIIGISILALLALFLAAQRFEKAGGAFRWIARPLSIIGWACLHGSIVCKRHLDSTLEWPPKANVIARTVYLVLALFIYAGDFALARLRSAAFFGVHAGKLAWLPLDNFSGLLWLCVSALWGIMLLDLIDLIPHGWRLLPVERLSKIVRIIATILALALFIVSALMMAYFVLWGQMQISDQVASTTDAAVLGFNISLLFGLLLGLASAIALWALFVGIAGVYTILVALSYFVLRILALGLGIFGHSLDTAGDAYIKPVPFPFLQLTQNTPTTPLLQISSAASGLLPAATGEPTNQEDSMADKQREQVVTRTHIANYGYRISPKLDSACEETGSIRLIRQQAVVDLSRPKGGGLRPRSQSIQDMTPHSQIDDLIKAGTPAKRAYSRIMHTVVSSIVNSFTLVPVIKRYDLIITDLLLIPHIAESLQDLHRRSPHHSLLILSKLSEHLLEDAETAEALACSRSLWEEKVILNTLLIHDRSPFAKRVGEETQEKFKAKSLASLLVSHVHSDFNPTFGEVFERLGSLSPYSTLAFASAEVSPGKATPGQRMVNALRAKEPAKGKGDLNDCINQTINLFQEVCKAESFAMAEQGVMLGDPLYFLVNEPLPRDDPRFTEYRETTHTQLMQTSPKANLIVVRGSGTPEYKDNAAYHIQCTTLLPMTITAFDPPQVNAAETPLATDRVQPDAAPVQMNGRRSQQSSVA